MRKCKNKVSQFILRGYHYKEVKLSCGSTAVDGSQLICDDCNDKLRISYPQGWRKTPGDLCKHGNYVGDRHGRDYLCGLCESE